MPSADTPRASSLYEKALERNPEVAHATQLTHEQLVKTMADAMESRYPGAKLVGEPEFGDDRRDNVLSIAATLAGAYRLGRWAGGPEAGVLALLFAFPVRIGLAGEARLGEVRHPHDRSPPRAIEMTLGPCGELRPLHAEIGPPAMNRRSDRFTCLRDDAGQLGADRVGQADVRHDPLSEKSALSSFCQIIKLARDRDMARGDRFFHAADRADGENPLHPQLLHGKEIGPIVDLRGEKRMAPAVPRQESDRNPLQGPEDELPGGLSERGRNRHLPDLFQRFHLV